MERDFRTFFTLNSTNTTTLQTYSANTWYRITLRLDTDTDQFAFYIDDELKGSGYFRTAVGKIDIFNICSGGSGAIFGDFWVDYIKVYQGEPKADARTELTAGTGVSAGGTDTSASVTFTGASGLTLGKGDFTVSAGATISAVNVSGNTVTVTAGFPQNSSTTESKIYTIGIAPGSVKIKGAGTVDITQGINQSTVASISGIVKGNGIALSNASVVIVNEADNSITFNTSTALDGTYSIPNLALNTSWAITVTAAGWKTRTAGGFMLESPLAYSANFDLLNTLTGTVVYDMDFDALANGTFNDAGWQFQNGSAVIETDPGNLGNKALRLRRSSGSFDFVNKTANTVSGQIFTIDVRIKRTATGSQWALYTNNVSTLAGNSNSVVNIVLTSGIGTHADGNNSSNVTNVESLAINTWYKVTIVVHPSSGVDTFDYYVDGVKKLENKPVRNDYAVNYFHFFTSNNNVGDLTLDYFRVYAGQPQ
jgi:hypothetical protein